MKMNLSTFAFALSSILIFTSESRAVSSFCEEVAADYYSWCLELSEMCPELQSPKACDDTSIYLKAVCESDDPDDLEIFKSIFTQYERTLRECVKRRIGGDRDYRLS